MATTLTNAWKKIYDLPASNNSSNYDGYRYWSMRVYLAYDNQSIDNNTSRLWWEVDIYTTSAGGGSGYNDNSHPFYLKVGNQVLLNQSIKVGTVADGSYKKIAGGTVTISHASDGTWANKLVDASGYAYQRSVGESDTYVTIPAIPRASVPTLSVSSLIANGSNAVTINTNRASSSFTHKITYSCAGGSGTIATGVGSSYKWTVPQTIFNSATNATSMTVTITVETFKNSTQTSANSLGSNTVAVTVKIDSSYYAPSVSTPTISEGNAVISTQIGSQWTTVSALSKKTLTVPFTIKSGTTVDTVTCTCGGTTKTMTVSGSTATYTWDKPPGKDYEFKVKDKRGLTTTLTKTGSWIAYTKPAVSKITARRDSAFSTDGSLIAEGTYWNGSIGSTANTASVTWKLEGGSYSSPVTLDDTVTGSRWETDPVQQTGLSTDNSYKFTVKVTDSFSQTNELSYTLGPEIEALWVGKKTVQAKDLLVLGKFAMKSDSNTLYNMTTLPTRLSSVESTASTANTTANTANTQATTNKNALANIGTMPSRSTASNVSCATSTNKVICSIELAAGKWLLIGTISYSTNSTGVRWNYLGANTTTGTTVQTNVSQAACSNTQTFVQNAQVYNISSTTTYNLVGWQNSGSTLTCGGHIVAIRIK